MSSAPGTSVLGAFLCEKVQRVMNQSVFFVAVQVPAFVAKQSREDFLAHLWELFGAQGLVGIHEGSVLSEEAAELGLELNTWTVDSGEAPRERDWVGQRSDGEVHLYFDRQDQAEAARVYLQSLPELTVGPAQEQKPQDWDAEWKASFLNAGQGVEIPPFWRIVPPWTEKPAESLERWLRINPGAGFGTGTHETTQLCLEAIGNVSRGRTLSSLRALDFGSGSGILSIALAQLGMQVEGVEIDPLAIDNARENAALNSVSSSIVFEQNLGEVDSPYPIVVANILRPVLIEFASELTRRLDPHGTLILSGLIESDVASVLEVYSALLPQFQFDVFAKGEWRAIVGRAF